MNEREKAKQRKENIDTAYAIVAALVMAAIIMFVSSYAALPVVVSK